MSTWDCNDDLTPNQYIYKYIPSGRCMDGITDMFKNNVPQRKMERDLQIFLHAETCMVKRLLWETFVERCSMELYWPGTSFFCFQLFTLRFPTASSISILPYLLHLPLPHQPTENYISLSSLTLSPRRLTLTVHLTPASKPGPIRAWVCESWHDSKCSYCPRSKPGWMGRAGTGRASHVCQINLWNTNVT